MNIPFPMPSLKNSVQIVTVVVIMGAMTGLITYVQSIRHDNDLMTLQNKNQAQTIIDQNGIIDRQHTDMRNMIELRTMDAEIMAGLYRDNQTLAKSQVNRANARTQLENTNVVVKNYMDDPVPPDLASLLNKQIAEYANRVQDKTGESVGGTAQRPAEPGH